MEDAPKITASKDENYTNMTKREYFSVLLLQTLLGDRPNNASFSLCAAVALEAADALIKELNK